MDNHHSDKYSSVTDLKNVFSSFLIVFKNFAILTMPPLDKLKDRTLAIVIGGGRKLLFHLLITAPLSSSSTNTPWNSPSSIWCLAVILNSSFVSCKKRNE